MYGLHLQYPDEFIEDFRLKSFFSQNLSVDITFACKPQKRPVSIQISSFKETRAGKHLPLTDASPTHPNFVNTKRICKNPSLHAGISMILSVIPGNPSELKLFYQEKKFVAGRKTRSSATTAEKCEVNASGLLLHMLRCAVVQPRLLSAICIHIAFLMQLVR